MWPQAISAIERTSPDLVLLDIQMPQIDGPRWHAARYAMPAVVFATAATIHARRVGSACADYVLAAQRRTVKSALVHARQHPSARRATGFSRRPSAARSARHQVERPHLLHPHRDIDWCEAAELRACTWPEHISSAERWHISSRSSITRSSSASIADDCKRRPHSGAPLSFGGGASSCCTTRRAHAEPRLSQGLQVAR